MIALAGAYKEIDFDAIINPYPLFDYGYCLKALSQLNINLSVCFNQMMYGMIDLADAYKEIEANSQKFLILNFNCEHCEQAFNHFVLNLSVFIYGVAFLVGKDLCYAGITCPKCLKTILMKGDSLTRLQQDLHSDLRYCSSIINPYKHVEYLESFQIKDTEHFFSDGVSENFYNMLTESLEEKPKLERDYVCSYIKNSNLPIGYAVSVWWFKPDDIEKLVQIENEHKFRVFPRYIYKILLHELSKTVWYEKYDAFCWQYKLYQDYFDRQIKNACDTFNILSDLADRENISRANMLGYDIKKNISKNHDGNTEIISGIYDTKQEIISENYVEHLSISHAKYMEHQYKEFLYKDTQAASNFLDLILNFDPIPWDIPNLMSLWKSLTPFRGTSVPTSSEEFDPKKYTPRMSDAEVEEIAEKVHPLKTKSHVQDWANDNYKRFIEKYISLARRSDFSYGYVWDLKCKFLKKLSKVALNPPVIINAENAFYVGVDTTSIVYKGTISHGLIGKGYKYIQYLMMHENKYIDNLDLIKLFPKDEEDDLAEETDTTKKTDDKNLEWLREEILSLKEEREIALNNKDLAKLEQVDTRLQQLDNEWKQISKTSVESKKVKAKKFPTNAFRKQDSVKQAIRRAIIKLKETDRKTWEHFDKALKPVGLDYCRYHHPDESIDWDIK
ncbi:MAG: hypothetical protein R6X10_15580 [Desulfobacterales bacterium]